MIKCKIKITHAKGASGKKYSYFGKHLNFSQMEKENGLEPGTLTTLVRVTEERVMDFETFYKNSELYDTNEADELEGD